MENSLDRMKHELLLIQEGASQARKAARRLADLLDELCTADNAVMTKVDPSSRAVDEASLARARAALRRVGYSEIRVTTSGSSSAESVEALSSMGSQSEDMRAIERTGSGRYRCTLRGGKERRRLVSGVFETAEEARAARNARELQVRTARR